MKISNIPGEVFLALPDLCQESLLALSGGHLRKMQV
jgi:hypothetical protein